jgi:Flp pilus assembly protein TadG
MRLHSKTFKTVLARFRRDRRGQTAVESALVFLVLLITVIGIFDLGQILFIHQTFMERVRGAARYAAVNTFDATAFTNMVLYNQTTVPPGQSSGIFGLTSAMVSVTQSGAGTSLDFHVRQFA